MNEPVTRKLRIMSAVVQLEIGSDGTEVTEWIGELMTGHWHYRPIGKDDEDGVSMFKATWISGAKECDDCVPT